MMVDFQHAQPKIYSALSLLLASTLLSACGGGGSATTPVVLSPAPVVTPIPTPAPAPATPVSDPTQSAFITAEFQANQGLARINPIRAYERGATGRGVILSVLDTGINPTLSEFAGRVEASSADLIEPGPIRDIDGHGSAVTAVVAAARNATGVHGVAFDAQIYAGRILSNFFDSRPSGASQAELQAENIRFFNGFAAGLDQMRAIGSRVVNLSIGFSEVTVTNPGAPAPPSGPLNAAVANFSRAEQQAFSAGTVFVIAAGNENAARPNSFPRMIFSDAPRLTNATNVLIVGAVDTSNQIASFSNRAGTGAEANVFLVAPGTSVRSIDETGAGIIAQGTSLAAPFVTGALGLLLQAFPTLTAPQAADLLLRTATDLGAPGTDSVFGRGLVNVAAAFQPQGVPAVTTASGASIALTPTSGLVAGGAFGAAPALQQALRFGLFSDDYGRPFAADFSSQIKTRMPALGLARQGQVLERAQAQLAGRGFGFYVEGVTKANHLNAIGGATPASRVQQVKAQGAFRLAPNTQLGFALGVAGNTPFANTASAARASLTAQETRLFTPSQQAPDLAFDIAHQVGAWTLTGQWQTEHTRHSRPFTQDTLEARSQTAMLWASRSVKNLNLSFGLGVQQEKASLLGALGGQAFGLASGATNLLADAGAQGRVGPLHVLLRGRLVQAHPHSQGGHTGLVRSTSTLLASAFSAHASLPFNAGAQTLWLALSQPLRVEKGQSLLDVPTAFDLAQRQFLFDTKGVSLAPSGRELAFELGYTQSWHHAHLSLNSFVRSEPGHTQGLGPDVGLLARWSTAF